MVKILSTASDWTCERCNTIVKGDEYHVCGLPDGVTANIVPDELEAIPQPDYTLLLDRIADALERIAISMELLEMYENLNKKDDNAPAS